MADVLYSVARSVCRDHWPGTKTMTQGADRIAGSLMGVVVALILLSSVARAHVSPASSPLVPGAHRGAASSFPVPRAPHAPRHAPCSQVRSTSMGRGGVRCEPRPGWSGSGTVSAGDLGSGVALSQARATRRGAVRLRRLRGRAPPVATVEPTFLLDPRTPIPMRAARRSLAKSRVPPIRSRSTQPIVDPVSGAGACLRPANSGAAVPTLPRPPREGRGGVSVAFPFHGGSP